MSLLRSFKETLKPCCNSSSFSQPSLSQQPPLPSVINQRKPPKSSLSRQLQRLEHDYLPSTQESHFENPKLSLPQLKNNAHMHGEQDDDDHQEEAEEEEVKEFGRAELSRVQFEDTGPYEPLVLSSDGEFPIIQVPAYINCRLLAYQREGVKFLYMLYRSNHGGILGDDMGLGKTIQTIAFLAAVYGKDEEYGDSRLLKENQIGQKGPVLIICPTSVICNWKCEFSRWAPFNVSLYHGSSRELILEKLQANGVEVLVTSFDTFRIHGNLLSEIKWEIVVVDEAHHLKNEKSKLYSACLEIKTHRRIGLTGTIMQNKIMELFNLFDWAAPGSLGAREHFREATAPERFIRVAGERKQHLVAVLHKYMLRRTKEETIGQLMLGKEDNVIFCAMSELQKRVYQRMLQLPDVQCLINKDLPCSCGSPLAQVECCKRIVPKGIIWPYLHRGSPEGCDSCPFCLVLPCLVRLQQISNHLELIKPNPRDEPDKQRKDAEFASAVFGPDIDMVGGNAPSKSFMDLSDTRYCGKMRALEKLMSSWALMGDKILLFSYSVRMLDILEKFLIRKGFCFSRLDGSTPTNMRQSLVDEFNSSPSKQVFLISTRAGGLGLNLVYKQQLSNIAVSGKMEKRYFEGVQDCKEFQGELFGICNLFRDLSDKLFTSEILELHEKQGQQHTEHDSDKQELTSLGSLPTPTEGSETFSSVSKNLHPGDIEIAATDKPVLEDLGILYAHRNEDIVNSSAGIQQKIIVLTGDNNPRIDTNASWKRKTDWEENDVSTRDGKKIQYGRLAQFKGMGVVEFSKWVLSATPSDRESLLRNYKRRKKEA
ncbi:hypothetical protein E1A91_A12G150300v1 [Gossypium mustelinum]|uniref:Helicase ATP-binding domain-containing protein n=1 Tax=Gossypium mustelinum TaxID=34275 RepID=A0A5D2WUK1_GOSMU|nr:hypothetical protein E1A91_A12G150300v1 [Gossypium mustelinum]